MKKIFLLFAAICVFIACDPVSEDISNGGHITADELQKSAEVYLNKTADGKNGNLLTCKTTAPVTAKWSIDGKDVVANDIVKKLKVGPHDIVLTGLCPDGTVVTSNYNVTCDVITDELIKVYIYGEDPVLQPPFSPGAWDAAAMRFSDNEGKYFRYLTPEEYEDHKTLILDVAEASADCSMKVMNGWWSAFYFDSDAHPLPVAKGLMEITINDAIDRDCSAKYKDADPAGNKDLQFMIVTGSCTINSCYYEE